MTPLCGTLLFSSPTACGLVDTNHGNTPRLVVENSKTWRSPHRIKLYYRTNSTAVLSLSKSFLYGTPFTLRSAFERLTPLTSAPETLSTERIEAGVACSARSASEPSGRMTSELPHNALGISTAAMLGVLLRLGVNRIFGENVGNITSASSALFNDLPANFLGCFILGFHQSMKRSLLFPDWFNLAVSTGFAGSVTTFASWHLQLVVLLVGGPRLPAFVAIPIGVSMAFFGLTLGKDFGDFLLHILGHHTQEDISHSGQSVLNATGRPSSVTSRTKQICNSVLLVLAFVILYGAMVAGAILDSRSFSVSHRRFFWMCGVFAPFGALLRWWLSRFNGKAEKFPLGTFAANMTAMVLDLSIAVVLQVRQEISQAAVFVLVAVISGLGGSLSTVSTWVNEATKLRRTWRYLYILGTISAALTLGLIMYGIAFWVS